MSAVPKLWPGCTMVCIASGPSLTQDDVDYVRGKARVIVVNNNYADAPWADVLYAADFKWWNWYWEKGPKGHEHFPIKAFQGLKYTPDRTAVGKFRLKHVAVSRMDGLDLRPTHICRGHNGGYQAINLAVHFGARRIVLLGYDMQRGPKGEEHHHGEHPNHSRSPYQTFAASFLTIKQPLKDAGVEVVNCTRRTALTCFPKMPLREALPETAVVAA